MTVLCTDINITEIPTLMTYCFLPYQGVTWLCQVIDSQVHPLTQAPGDANARWRLSESGKEFGNIDQAGKRIGHYRILDEAPWIEAIVPPLALPRTAIANDLVIYQGFMVVAGHARSGEALWTRSIDNDRKWNAIPLPNGLAKRGKSIDALFVREGKLVAIDNIVIPKWILVYDLNRELNATDVEVVPLKTHTTYESVRSVAEGDDFYALQSTGINHGNVSSYISLLDKYSLKEKANWVFPGKRNNPFDFFDPLFDDREHDETPKSGDENMPRHEEVELPCSSVSDMKFCKEFLLACAYEHGAFVSKIPEKGKIKRGNTLPKFKKFPLKKLTQVDRFEMTPGNSSGLFAVGEFSNGVPDYEWIGYSDLVDFMLLDR